MRTTTPPLPVRAAVDAALDGDRTGRGVTAK